MRNVDFNIMISSEIKSHAFIPYKKSVFTRLKVLKRGKYFIFIQGYFHENVLYKVFARIVSRTVTGHIKLYP